MTWTKRWIDKYDFEDELALNCGGWPCYDALEELEGEPKPMGLSCDDADAHLIIERFKRKGKGDLTVCFDPKQLIPFQYIQYAFEQACELYREKPEKVNELDLYYRVPDLDNRSIQMMLRLAKSKTKTT